MYPAAAARNAGLSSAMAIRQGALGCPMPPDYEGGGRRGIGAPPRRTANSLTSPSCGLSSGVGRNQAGLQCVTDQSGDIPDAQPLHDLRAMGLDGLDRQVEIVGDLLGA